jgi:hypothetical protein
MLGISSSAFHTTAKLSTVYVLDEETLKMRKFLGIALIMVLGAALLTIYLGTPRTFELPIQSTSQSTTKIHHSGSGAVLPGKERFYALHGDTHNSDELSVNVSHGVQWLWTAEPDLYVAEGPTEDSDGNIYFSPIGPKENLILVSLEPESGSRRWAVPADSEALSAGGGAPLILNDPHNPGQQIIYIGVYHRAVALKQDGTVIWDVSTGLEEPILGPGELDARHVFGLNYQPQSDALVGLTAAGEVYVLDRESGKQLLEQPHEIEGAPGKSETGGPAESVTARVDDKLASVFGELDHGRGRFSSIIQALFGGGYKVSNYFAIDKNSGRIFVAATAPDEADGQLDGVSGYGSLYAFDLVQNEDGFYQLITAARRDFTGGTGASPALSSDGTRVYTADNDHHVLAFDRDLNPLWSIELGENIPASISISSKSNDLYAVSLQNIYKLIDNGDHAELAWQSDLDMFPELGPWKNFNMTTATIVSNGVAVVVGAGFSDGNFTLPVRYGAGLLDSETGKLLSYNPVREESVSVTMISADGGYYLANSPVRRAVARTVFGPLVRPLTGGISRYAPIRSSE